MLRRPEGTVIDPKVLWAIKDGGLVVRQRQSDGRHEREEKDDGNGQVERREGGRTLIFMRKGKSVSWVKKKGENEWLKDSNRINENSR